LDPYWLKIHNKQLFQLQQAQLGKIVPTMKQAIPKHGTLLDGILQDGVSLMEVLDIVLEEDSKQLMTGP